MGEQDSEATVAPIRHLLALNSENQWSDLLATLIETDPRAAAPLVGSVTDADVVEVVREGPGAGRDRIDMLVRIDGEVRAAVEVKVLAGLGPRQLDRYLEATPHTDRHLVVAPWMFPLGAVVRAPWRSVSIEEVLGSLATSRHSWVATTAQLAADHLRTSLPAVDADTVWDRIPDGRAFPLALRARMAWVHHHLSVRPDIDHDLVGSTSGVSWVVRMYRDTPRPGYDILVEAEETLPNRSYPAVAGPGRNRPRGPSVKVMLRLSGVESSKTFDWEYLRSLWPIMAAARDDWVTNRAGVPAQHDKVAWAAMVERGAPRHLGIGFGDRQARLSGFCMFGARFQLPRDITLGALVKELEQCAHLLRELAEAPPPAAWYLGRGAGPR